MTVALRRFPYYHRESEMIKAGGVRYGTPPIRRVEPRSERFAESSTADG